MFIEQRCPECNEVGFATQESRKTREAIRRRRVCPNCGFRQTTYEVTQQWYREAQRNRDIVLKLRRALDSETEKTLSKKKVVEASCSMCSFMSERGCFFDFPEAGGEFATECSQYTPVENG